MMRAAIVLVVAGVLVPAAAQPTDTAVGAARGACFLMYEVGVGEVRRDPADTCAARVSPQSTFKIPHALAALDAGVISGLDEVIRYDGRETDFAAWRQDHTLATAMRYSVVWFFQEIARRLGESREREYLSRFHYGNADASSGLTTFWLGGSLAVSPEEQAQFLLALYGDRLPVKAAAAAAVRRILVQPPGKIVNATGEMDFAAPWPGDAIVSAKTGSGSTPGGAVRWLVGRVERGPRAWVFVSNVIGARDLPPQAAIQQAERALIATGVLR